MKSKSHPLDIPEFLKVENRRIEPRKSSPKKQAKSICILEKNVQLAHVLDMNNGETIMDTEPVIETISVVGTVPVSEDLLGEPIAPRKRGRPAGSKAKTTKSAKEAKATEPAKPAKATKTAKAAEKTSAEPSKAKPVKRERKYKSMAELAKTGKVDKTGSISTLHRIDPDAKINIVGEPTFRVGSDAAANAKLIRKYKGKTVKTYLANGGETKHIRSMIKRGLIEVTSSFGTVRKPIPVGTAKANGKAESNAKHAKSGAKRAPRLDPSAKIRILSKPAFRAGSVRQENASFVAKHNGKTVKTYIANGGKPLHIRFLIEKGLAELVS